MLRSLMATLVFMFVLSSTAWAEDTKSEDFADFSLNAGFSPFGGSVNYGHNMSKKTTWIFAFGFNPGLDAPFKPKYGGEEFTVTSTSTWMGAFANHRPIASAEWFRVVAGIGLGYIEHEMDDGNGNTYKVEYRENPVGYLGVGFGAEAKKGFVWGVDIGILQTSGPDITKTSEMGEDVSDEIRDDLMFSGKLLPNLQVTLGYGF